MSVLPGADQQLSRRCLDRAHCFDRVQDQVQDHLLQLNAIAVNAEIVPQQSRVWTETRFLMIALRTQYRSPRSIAALRSNRSFRGGAFLI